MSKLYYGPLGDATAPRTRGAGRMRCPPPTEEGNYFGGAVRGIGRRISVGARPVGSLDPCRVSSRSREGPGGAKYP
jgi:hypothetical protein